MGDFIRLMRIGQWYKNLLVFLPLFFSGGIMGIQSLLMTLLGFFALCLMSSSGYIVNDLLDRKEDMLHPEKKGRPIASGRVRHWQALIVLMVLLLAGLGLAASLSFMFFALAGTLFMLMLAYDFYARSEPFLDIILIGVNYILRAVSGAYVLSTGMAPYIHVSPWLVLCPFFLALFLASAKRRADFLFLGKDSGHRESLTQFSSQITQSLMTISTTLLVLSYGFYTFLSEHHSLIFTLPFALYTVFRYYALVENGSVIGRWPEKFYRDTRLVVAILMWVGLTTVMLYA